jgi:hypothetical protein
MASSTNTPYLQPPEPPYIQPQAVSGTGVRLHGLHFIRTSWQTISRASKFMLVTSVFFIVAQVRRSKRYIMDSYILPNHLLYYRLLSPLPSSWSSKPKVATNLWIPI